MAFCIHVGTCVCFCFWKLEVCRILDNGIVFVFLNNPEPCRHECVWWVTSPGAIPSRWVPERSQDRWPLWAGPICRKHRPSTVSTQNFYCTRDKLIYKLATAIFSRFTYKKLNRFLDWHQASADHINVVCILLILHYCWILWLEYLVMVTSW